MAQAQTPAAGPSKKQLHWAVQFASSPITSSDSRDTSIADPAPATLQYVNAQLIAHGFTSSPGISLDGLSGAKADNVVKTVFALLGQRMEDLQRTEDLSTKLRTLSYDYERLMSMHKSASAAAAEAEREASTVKSKLVNSAKALAQSETAHKQSQVELQRTRTSLQALRSQHVAELKKRDAEHTRMADRWSKLSDSQLKIHTVPARMTMTSAALPSAAVNAQIMEGGQKAFVDAALEAAESAAKQLREENAGLRQLVLDSANAVRKILHKATVPDPDDFIYPAPLEVADVFAPCATPAAEGAFAKLSELLTALRNAVTALRSDEPRLVTSAAAADAGPSRPNAEAEVDRLQRTVEALCEELELAQDDARAHATRAESLFAQLSAKPSVDTKVVDELESQRVAVDEAAMNVGRDRAALESERLTFLAEKRAWEMGRILANEAPPRPSLPHHPRDVSPARSPPASPPPQRQATRAASPLRSPRKARPHAVSPRKPKHKSPLKPTRSRVTAAYETEVAPAPQGKLLRTSFALPPPTPRSSIAPLSFGDKKKNKQSDGEKRLAALFGDADKPPVWPDVAPNQVTDDAATESTTPPYPPAASASNAKSSEATSSAPAGPTAVFSLPAAAPAKNPFPVARVNAPRMVHAYSPARPSPLSRILALAQSPESARGPPKLPSAFAALEESELQSVATDPSSSGSGSGVIDEESPLRDKAPMAAAKVDDKKGKRRANDRAGAEEKENTIRRKLRGPAHAPRPPVVKKSTGPGASTAVRKTVAGPTASTAASRNGARPAPHAAAGGKAPRRVPVAGSETAR